jgi:hypothetical protein
MECGLGVQQPHSGMKCFVVATALCRRVIASTERGGYMECGLGVQQPHSEMKCKFCCSHGALSPCFHPQRDCG